MLREHRNGVISKHIMESGVCIFGYTVTIVTKFYLEMFRLLTDVNISFQGQFCMTLEVNGSHTFTHLRTEHLAPLVCLNEVLTAAATKLSSVENEWPRNNWLVRETWLSSFLLYASVSSLAFCWQNLEAAVNKKSVDSGRRCYRRKGHWKINPVQRQKTIMKLTSNHMGKMVRISQDG